MRRFVYLFELDSVRNSKKEIQRGQQALFEEIVKKGNTVVLSFNQLTDSEAFLCAIRDEKAYEQMVQLFALGAIKNFQDMEMSELRRNIYRTQLTNATIRARKSFCFRVCLCAVQRKIYLRR